MTPSLRSALFLVSCLAFSGCIITTSPPTDGGGGGQTCSVNGDCDTDEYCVGNGSFGSFCRKACETSICSSTTSCQTLASGRQACLPLFDKGQACDVGVCRSGLICTGDDRGRICMSDCTASALLCTSTERCAALVSGSSACFPTVGAGQACTDGRVVCEAGLDCTGGVCVSQGGSGSKGSVCTSEADCGQGLRCVGSQTYGYYCRTDCTGTSSTCTSSESCESLTGGGSACVPAVGSGQSCNGATTVCQSGLTCSSGTCTSSSGGPGSTCGTALTFNNQTAALSSGGTAQLPSTGCALATGATTWYSVTVPGNSTVNITATSSADIVLNVLSSCASTSCIDFADQSSSGTETVSISNTSASSMTYRLAVSGINSSTSGTYTLLLQNGSSSADGAVVFWEVNGSGCAVDTDVTLGTSTGTISGYSQPTPACGATGTASFSLAPGVYSYTATCTKSQASQASNTKNGSFTVSSSQCTAVQLIWN